MGHQALTLQRLSSEGLLSLLDVVKVEELGRNDFRAWFIRLIVVGCEVLWSNSACPSSKLYPATYRVCQRVFNRDTLLGIEGEAFLHQIDSHRLCVGVHVLILALLLEWQRSQVVSRSVRVDLVEVVERRRAQHIENQCKLVMVVSPGEERFAREHLRKDAPDGPAGISVSAQLSS